MDLNFSDLEVGTVPEWISAVVTFLALIAAGAAAVFAFLQARAAQTQVHSLEAEAQERRQLQRQEQAAQVTAWLTKDGTNNFVVLLFNASKQPVYNTALTFVAPNNNNDMLIGSMAPTESPTVAIGMSQFINAERLTVKSIDLSWDLPNQNGPVKTLQTQEDGTSRWVEGEWHAGPIGIGMTFTDTSGVRWERTIQGHLNEVASDYKVSSSYVLG